MDWLADRAGFELAVRPQKFAFEISTGFPASLTKIGLRENFAPEVLLASFRLSLCGAVFRAWLMNRPLEVPSVVA
jgi:hypothetical protein